MIKASPTADKRRSRDQKQIFFFRGKTAPTADQNLHCGFFFFFFFCHHNFFCNRSDIFGSPLVGNEKRRLQPREPEPRAHQKLSQCQPSPPHLGADRFLSLDVAAATPSGTPSPCRHPAARPHQSRGPPTLAAAAEAQDVVARSHQFWSLPRPSTGRYAHHRTVVTHRGQLADPH